MTIRDDVGVSEVLDPEALAKVGVFTFATFQDVVAKEQEWMVDGLLMERSVNLLVGDSGLGKTPFGVSLGICIAAGIPFMGREVRQGRVLYCDTESTQHDFNRIIGSVSRTMGLSAPPQDFFFWSPYWTDRVLDAPLSRQLFEHVEAVKPTLAFVDPLRTFWPHADQKGDEAMRMITAMRKLDTSWLITHHRRKERQDGFMPTRLADDPQGWFQAAAGVLALINHTDARLGAEKQSSGEAELLIGGFVRSFGPINPLYLAREYDDAGKAQGYRSVMGSGFLSDSEREVWNSLGGTFRYKDVKRALGGNSDSNTKRLLGKLQSLGLAQPDAKGKAYRKASGDGVHGERIH